MDINKRYPCVTCVYKTIRTIHEEPCSKCCEFGVKGFPGYKAVPGTIIPENFEL
jgi:hypothetical protein